MNTTANLAKKIRSVTARAHATAEDIERQIEAARVERSRRDAEAAEKAAHQAALQGRLDSVIAQSMSGVRALLKLSNSRMMRKLLEARASIKQPTVLYSLGDHCMSVDVTLGQKGVWVTITAHLPSSCQADGELTRYETFFIQHLFEHPHKIPWPWFWHLYNHDMYFDWSPFKDVDTTTPDTARSVPNESTLSHVENLDLHKLALQIEKDEREERQTSESGEYHEPLTHHDGMTAHLVLLRFLMDCNTPRKLREHLAAAATQEFT